MRSFPSLVSNNSFATTQYGKLILKIPNRCAVQLPSFRLSLHSVGSLCLFSHLVVTFPVLLSTSLHSLFVTNYSLFVPNCPYFSLSIVFLSLCVGLLPFWGVLESLKTLSSCLDTLTNYQHPFVTLEGLFANNSSEPPSQSCP